MQVSQGSVWVARVRSATAATVACVAAGLPALPAWAQSQTYNCPMRVASQAASVAEQPGTEFKIAFLPTSLSYLIGVAMIDRSSPSGAELPATAQGGDLLWRFEGGAKGGAALVCRYEGGIQLTRAVNPSAKQCLATLQRSAARGSDGYGLDRATVVCQ